MKTALLSVLVMAASVAFAAEPGTVKIALFKEVISPEVGAKICGYDADQVSVTKHDDLYAIGLSVENGPDKLLIIALDLLGLDGETVRDLRAMSSKFSCAARIPECFGSGSWILARKTGRTSYSTRVATTPRGRGAGRGR